MLQNDLNDGKDEILGNPPLPHVTLEMQYVTILESLKLQHNGVNVWVSPEFKALRNRLRKVAGLEEANRIMSNNP